MARGSIYNLAYLSFQDNLYKQIQDNMAKDEANLDARIEAAKANLDALNGRISTLAQFVDDPQGQQFAVSEANRLAIEQARLESEGRGSQTVGFSSGFQDEPGRAGRAYKSLAPDKTIAKQLNAKDTQAASTALREMAAEGGEAAATAANNYLNKLTGEEGGFAPAKNVTMDQAIMNSAAVLGNLPKGKAADAVAAQLMAQWRQAGEGDAFTQVVTAADIWRSNKGSEVDAINLEFAKGFESGATGPQRMEKESSYTQTTRKLGETPVIEGQAYESDLTEGRAELEELRRQRKEAQGSLDELFAMRHPDVMKSAEELFREQAPIYQEKSRRAKNLAREFADALAMERSGRRPEDLLQGTPLENIDPSMYDQIDMSSLPQVTRRLAQQAQLMQTRMKTLGDIQARRPMTQEIQDFGVPRGFSKKQTGGIVERVRRERAMLEQESMERARQQANQDRQEEGVIDG